MSSRMLVTIVITATISGCGGGGPSPGSLPPHGGSLIPLAGAEGFVEVVRDGPRMIAYFLGPDHKPLAPVPTGARLTLRGAGKKAVELRPVADPGNSGGPLRGRGGRRGRLGRALGEGRRQAGQGADRSALK